MSATAITAKQKAKTQLVDLSKVTRAKIEKPPRILIYGPEGVGKSTLVADAGEFMWIDCEAGTDSCEVARYPFHDGDTGHVPESLEQIYGALEVLRNADHRFKGVAIDGLDTLEKLVWAAVCDRYSGRADEQFNKKGRAITHIEQFGYGKGYALAVAEWRTLAERLDTLRSRGMAVFLIGHSQIKTYHNPEGEDYDRFTLLAHKDAAAFLGGWVDVLGFLNFETFKSSEDGKGKSTGERILRLAPSAAYQAKCRFDLPSEILIPADNPWSPIREAFRESKKETKK